MKLAKFEKKFIFCVEGNWTTDLKNKTSIKSALDFLEHNDRVKYIHRNCSTVEQLEELLKHSLFKKYDEYGIIYLAFHGVPSRLLVTKRKKIDLNTIATIVNGSAKGKIIHFGSCSTLNISAKELKEFCKKTGALAISGYTKEISFKQSMMLDLSYFQVCQEYRDVSMIENDLKKYNGKLARELGFKMSYN